MGDYFLRACGYVRSTTLILSDDYTVNPAFIRRTRYTYNKELHLKKRYSRYISRIGSCLFTRRRYYVVSGNTITPKETLQSKSQPRDNNCTTFTSITEA